ncbi:hypothetical protein ABTE52_19940, partial [Acinetobacter baumannii]
MPPAAPLAMPVAPLRAWRKQDQRPLTAPDRWRTPWFARLIPFGGMVAISGFGGYQMYKVVEAGGVTLLEWL